MNFRELVKKNRTYRRFYQEELISMETLVELVDNARIASSGMNRQALKYLLSTEREMNEKIFQHLNWAGYLKDWPGPEEGERPSAYVVMLHDKSIGNTVFWDHGIAASYILLGATEKGYGGCTIAAFNKGELAKLFNLPEHLDILMVLALGKPKEEVVLYEIEEGEDFKYWRDDKQVHHVPKRKLKNIIIRQYS